jgi:hypothetical protein
MNGQLVLEWDSHTREQSGFTPSQQYHYDFGHNIVVNGQPHENGWAIGHGEGVGTPMNLEAGKYYDIEILIAETDGGLSQFQLFYQEDGATYEQDAKGNPILPILRFAPMIPDDVQKNPDNYPPFMKNGPVWACELSKEAGGSTSLLPPRAATPTPAPAQ